MGKGSGFFSKITTVDESKKFCVDAAKGFYFVAVLQGGIGFFIDPSLLIDAFVFALLAFFLHKYQSRTSSVLLLIMAVLSIVSTFYNKVNVDEAVGGNNMFLAIIILYIAVRAVEASFKFHKYSKQA